MNDTVWCVAPGIGELTIADVYHSAGGSPILFLAKDENGGKWICDCVKYQKQWIAAPVSEEVANMILHGEITVRNAFDFRINETAIITPGKETEVARPAPVELLPSPNYYLEVD